MTPEHSFHSPEPATLDSLYRLAKLSGLDRLALVQRASAERPAGLCILLLGPTAVIAVVPLLQTTVAQLGGDKELLMFADDEPLYNIFKGMAKIGRQWGWQIFPRQPDSLCIFLLGPVVTTHLAAQLTQLGCITNLT